MPTLTYHGVVIPAGHECVGLTRIPVCDETGHHLYDEYSLHLRVPAGADFRPTGSAPPEPAKRPKPTPQSPPVPRPLAPLDQLALEQLRVAVREACAGAVWCKLITLRAHVTANAGRFRVLNDLTQGEMADMARDWLQSRRDRDGTIWVG